MYTELTTYVHPRSDFVFTISIEQEIEEYLSPSWDVFFSCKMDITSVFMFEKFLTPRCTRVKSMFFL